MISQPYEANISAISHKSGLLPWYKARASSSDGKKTFKPVTIEAISSLNVGIIYPGAGSNVMNVNPAWRKIAGSKLWVR